MDDFIVIAVVGEILKKLLEDNLSGILVGSSSPTISITFQSPKDMKTSDYLSIFLYQISENSHLKNQPMKRIESDRLQHPPLALNLYYLLTPSTKEPDGVKGWDTHIILGRAMQVLYDNTILEGPTLMDILKDLNREEYYEKIRQIRIILNSLSLDDLTKIWNSLDTALMLSVCYEVRVIMIESERIRETQRILEKNTDYYQITQTEHVR